MTKQPQSRLVYQITYAFRGFLVSTCFWSVAFLLIVIRAFMGALNPNVRTVFDSAYTVYGIPLVGFVGLSIVLMILGWKKGKGVSILRSEQGYGDKSHLGLTLTTGFLFLITSFLVYGVIQFVAEALSR